MFQNAPNAVPVEAVLTMEAPEKSTRWNGWIYVG